MSSTTANNASFVQDAASQRKTPMKVLCLGLPRAGTESLRRALQMLGIKGVYHGYDLYERPEDYRKWISLSRIQWNYSGKYQGEFSRELWDEVLSNCEATTDAPCSFFPYELMSAYPEAKIILNTRDFDAWQTSFRTTILPLERSWSIYLFSFLIPAAWQEWVLWNDWMIHFWQGDRQRNLKRRYEEHHALVRGLAAQKDRELLEWTVQDGWEPLCKFLDVPVPDAPFPKGNSHATFEERRTALLSQRMGASLTWVGYAGLSAVAAAGLLKASKYLKM